MPSKVLILGASGIIGQHLMISVPEGVDAMFTSKTVKGGMYYPLDVTSENLTEILNGLSPDVIVNLAGENSPDRVECGPECRDVNVDAVEELSLWCDENKAHLIHVSSQAAIDPVNEYGKQKRETDTDLKMFRNRWTIVRPSFVLGVRPFPAIGRENPVERILGGQEVRSVNDRWFTACFAWDVAIVIWD